MSRRAWVVLAVLAFPSAVIAAPPVVPDGPSTDGRLTLRASAISGFPDFVGVNGALRLPRSGVTLESGLWAFPMLGGGVYLRAGWAKTAFDNREGRDSGLTVETPLMLGVDFAGTTSDCCGRLGDAGWIGMDATANLDVTFWLARRFGINAEFTIGWMVGINERAAAGIPILRLSGGLAF